MHNLNHRAWQPVVTPTWCLNLANLSLSTLCLTGMSDRKTRKLDKDVPGCRVLGPRPLGGSGSIPGMLVPHSAAKALAMQTLRAPHTMVPASLAGQPDPLLHLLPTPLSFPLEGAVWQALEGGPGPSPFLQGRKGLLGWLGMQGRMNGHANEMLMNLGQDSPAIESWEPPHPSPREGLTRPAPAPSVGSTSSPSTGNSLGGEGGSSASRLGLTHSLPSVWDPSLVGAPPRGLAFHSAAHATGDCHCPPAVALQHPG